ncbi:MAG: hypothetical protein K2I77_01305, partial [Anaeroplasmataceae bacterium]|nr:hypothetical protein [Anaeroplasmataceae bacterium]
IYLVHIMEKLELGLKLITQLNQKGYEAYIIGGAVRDYILNLPISDVDICTNALPEEVSLVFPLVMNEGDSYLSCRVVLEDETFEVTTFRKDICYLDHRHPQTIQANSLKEDVLRRDFTMNAIAMDANKRLIDYCDGIEDIKQQKIVMIGDPKIRFEEDGLRVLRALDFSSRLNFNLDEIILKSLDKDYVGYLHEEMIITMLEKLFSNPYLNRLSIIKEYQLLKAFPVYQVIAEEAIDSGIRDIYAYFFVKHGFFPANLKLPKKIVIEAISIGSVVRNELDNYSLFKENIEICKRALVLYNRVHHTILDENWLMKRYEELPIHSLKDIAFDFNELQASKRAIAQNLVTRAILAGKLVNLKQWIMKYLENEGILS